MDFEMGWMVLPLAFALDFLLGDPRWLPHPIVWMGQAISRAEPLFRRWIKNEFTAGLLFALCLISVTWLLSFLAVAAMGTWHPVGGVVAEVGLLYYCFSTRTLETEATLVARALETGGIAAGRFRVSRIVGREVTHLDETGVVSAAVETVAENYVDGFLSPLFFYFLGGVPMALAYKMVNTLDSMVGYTSERYRLFGRAAARIDDAANYVPARLSVIMISLSAALLSWPRGQSAFLMARKEGRRHKSPNAGFPEAAFAGALAVRLGGPGFYHGRLVEKPTIGTPFAPPERHHIFMACELMMVAALLALVIFWGARVMAGFFQ